MQNFIFLRLQDQIRSMIQVVEDSSNAGGYNFKPFLYALEIEL